MTASSVEARGCKKMLPLLAALICATAIYVVVSDKTVFDHLSGKMTAKGTRYNNKASNVGIAIDELQKKHSYCFSNDILNKTDDGNGWFLDLDSAAHFVPAADEEIPPYDHLSCRVMKARYNCATANATTLGETAKLVLSLNDEPSNANSYCDLRELIKDLGGPVGLSRHLQTQSTNNKQAAFLMMGDSFLRQIWESLVCTYSQDLTKVRVLNGGPEAKYFVRDFKIESDDMGTLLHQVPDGCHGYPNQSVIAQYYRPGVQVPPQTGYCNDDLAMVEFDHWLRFYYIFHPGQYVNQSHLYDFLGMHPSQMRGLISNRAKGNMDHIILLRRIDPQLSAYSQSDILDRSLAFSGPGVLRPLYERDTHRWPSPDSRGQHPCMPGLPEDEANVILYCLYRGIPLRAGYLPYAHPWTDLAWPPRDYYKKKPTNR